MALIPAALISVGFLLLLLPHEAVAAKGLSSLPVRVTVENELSNQPPLSFSSSVLEGGVLLGALRRLQASQTDFKFTVTEHPDFGYFLESVNGVAGDEHEQTYWEILSESSGEFTRLDVGEYPPVGGVGCYVPKADENIVLRFSTWKRSSNE